MKKVSHEEFLKLKAEATEQSPFPKSGPKIDLVVGERYMLSNFDLIPKFSNRHPFEKKKAKRHQSEKDQPSCPFVQ